MRFSLVIIMNIHKPETQFKRVIEYLKQSSTVSEHNKKLILDFVDYFLAEGEGHSEIRAVKYIYMLKKVSEFLQKDFTKITKKDAITFFKDINTDKEKMEWTRHDYKVIAKRFYCWLDADMKKKPKQLKEAIEYIKSQKVKRARSKEKAAEHMLKPDEILKLADHTNNSRDRAFILTFYESMCRIGEILPVKIGDIESDDMGIKMNVSGKTGRRYIRLVVSSPAISNWLTNHPDRDNKEAYLFCGIGRVNQGQMLSYFSARKMIFETAEKAGIKKRVNLHKFRASRASELATSVSESVLCKLGGWEQNSSQLREYVFLSGADVDKEILRVNGLLKEEDAGNGFKLSICPRCQQRNTPKARFCSSCSLPLDERTVMRYDQQKEQATKAGFELFEAGESTQDAINQAILSEIQALRQQNRVLEQKLEAIKN